MSITKKEIQTIVEEELNEILGLGKLFKGKEKKKKSEDDKAALAALGGFSPDVQRAAAGASTTGRADRDGYDRLRQTGRLRGPVEEGEEERPYAKDLCFQLKQKLSDAEDEETTKKIKAEMERKGCSPFG